MFLTSNSLINQASKQTAFDKCIQRIKELKVDHSLLQRDSKYIQELGYMFTSKD